MKKINQIFLFCFVVILAAGCSTGSTAYKHGDYYRACLESIDRLRSNPKNTKSQNVLLQSYPLAQKTALREIDNAKLANTPDQYDIQVYQYDRLNQLADDIFKCPKALELIPQPTQYIVELSKAKQLAADRAYQMGVNAMNAGTMDQARVAWQYFQNADRYVKGYKDVPTKLLQARYAATLRVIVQRPILNQDYEYNADFFYNNLLVDLRRNAQNRFIRYYTQDEASHENMHNPHLLIVLNFTDFDLSDVKESNHTEELKRDSVKVGEVKVEGKIYDSYNTVRARLTVFRREISSGGTLAIRIIDAANNQEIQHRELNNTYVWYTLWAKFKGDDRALTNKQKELCNREPMVPPSDQALFIEFTKPLYPQALSFIQSNYGRY